MNKDLTFRYLKGMEGMLFICGVPIAFLIFVLLQRRVTAKKLAVIQFVGIVAAGITLLGVALTWLFYYSAVDEGIVFAAEAGDTARVETLMKWGANPNVEVDEFGYPLVAAVGSGRADTVKFLLDRGADPNVRNYGVERSLIRMAADSKRWDIVDLLKKAGGKP